MKRNSVNILTLRKNYNNNFEIFKGYDEMYVISARLGFKSSESAWKANPKYSINLANNALTKVKKKKRSPQRQKKHEDFHEEPAWVVIALEENRLQRKNKLIKIKKIKI